MGPLFPTYVVLENTRRKLERSNFWSYWAGHADVAGFMLARVRSPQSAVHLLWEWCRLSRWQPWRLSKPSRVSRPNQRSQLIQQLRVWAATAGLWRSPRRRLLPVALSKRLWRRACPLLLASFAFGLRMFWPISRLLVAQLLASYYSSTF